VETEEQLELVRAHGVSQVQGFLFAPPMQPAAIASLLQSEAAELPTRRKAS
jgi:EAL domain-containing protein (putative c-di-GMP-specific phosphodiesterase class I)